jgi:hypothetical protein
MGTIQKAPLYAHLLLAKIYKNIRERVLHGFYIPLQLAHTQREGASHQLCPMHALSMQFCPLVPDYVLLHYMGPFVPESLHATSPKQVAPLL